MNAQVILNALISGLTLSILSLGFSIIYRATGIFAIALAGAYALAPYLARQSFQLGSTWITAVSISLLAPILIMGAAELWNHRPLSKKSTSFAGHFMVSLGLYIVLIQVIVLVWGNESRTFRSGADATFALGRGMILTRSQVIAAVVSSLTISVFYLGFRHTNLGLRLRALSDNPNQLALLGCNIHSLRLVATTLAGLLASLSGLLTALDVGFDPFTGMRALLPAIVAVIVGGNGSFWAPVIGGILIGFLRVEVVWLWSARWQEVSTFLVLVAVLLLRPQGIFGKRVRVEAEY